MAVKKEEIEKYLNEKQPVYIYDGLIEKGLKEWGKGELIHVAIKGFKKFYEKEISTKYIKQFLPTLSEYNSEKVLKGKKPIKADSFKAKMSQKIRDLTREFETREQVKFRHEDTYIKSQKELKIFGYNKEGQAVVKEVKVFGVGKEVHNRTIPEVLTILK